MDGRRKVENPWGKSPAWVAADHFLSAPLLGFPLDLWAEFFVAHSTVQHLPNQVAKSVRNGRKALLVSETPPITAIGNLEDPSLASRPASRKAP